MTDDAAAPDGDAPPALERPDIPQVPQLPEGAERLGNSVDQAEQCQLEGAHRSDRLPNGAHVRADRQHHEDDEAGDQRQAAEGAHGWL